MDRSVLLYFVCVLAGVALIWLPLQGTFLAGIGTVVHVIGILAVLVFALVLLYLGILSLLNKKH